MKVTNNLHRPHWTGQELLGHLYGLDPPAGLSETHLDDCPECREKLSDLRLRRGALMVGPEVADHRLREQRRSVFARIEAHGSAWTARLAPAVATAWLVIAGVALQQPASQPEPKQTAVIAQSDRELLSEIASLAAEETPRAVDPIRGLFSDSSEKVEVQ